MESQTASAFDPTAFLDATTTEAATRRPPLPIENPAATDGLYIGVLGEPKVRAWQGTKDPSKSGFACDIPVTLDVPAQLQEQLKLQPQVILTGGGFIDTTPSGAMDWAPGRNRVLRTYRDATGNNVPGQPFSLRMLAGKVVKVKIANELYQGDVLDKISTVLKS